MKHLGSMVHSAMHDFLRFTKMASKAGPRLDWQTIQTIGDEYAVRRKQVSKTKMRWRVSSGARRSLWPNPVQGQCHPELEWSDVFRRQALSLRDSNGLSQ